jgi:carbamoyltransferase
LTAVLGVSASTATARLRSSATARSSPRRRRSASRAGRFDKRFPASAIRSCRDEAGVALREIDPVVFYEKPLRRVERLVSDFLAVAPRGRAQFTSATAELLGGKVDAAGELHARPCSSAGWSAPVCSTSA